MHRGKFKPVSLTRQRRKESLLEVTLEMFEIKDEVFVGPGYPLAVSKLLRRYVMIIIIMRTIPSYVLVYDNH